MLTLGAGRVDMGARGMHRLFAVDGTCLPVAVLEVFITDAEPKRCRIKVRASMRALEPKRKLKYGSDRVQRKFENLGASRVDQCLCT